MVLIKGNSKIVLGFLFIAIIFHAVILGIPLSKNTKTSTLNKETNISVFLAPPKLEKTNEQIEDQTQTTETLTEQLPDQTLDTTIAAASSINEATKERQNNLTIRQPEVITQTESLTSISKVRAFIQQDQTLDSSFSVNQNNKSFTTSDYISDLRNNPAKSNTGIQLESYTGEGSTHISIKSKNGEKCFQILNDSFPQSDFAPTPLFLQNINQGCGSAEVNPILRGLEERKSR